MVKGSLAWKQPTLKAKILDLYAEQYKILSVILVTLAFTDT